MKFLPYLLHTVFVLINSYIIILTWRLNALADIVKERTMQQKIKNLVTDAGPVIAISIVLLVLIHALINKKFSENFQTKRIVLFFLIGSVVTTLFVFFGMKL